MKSENILTCKEDIKAFLGDISDYIFIKYVKAGMPARCTGKGGEWIAHKTNLEKWFEAYTRVSMKNAVEETPEDIEKEPTRKGKRR